MDRSRYIFILLVLATCLINGCTDAPKPIPDDERILGTWGMVVSEFLGERSDVSPAEHQHVFDRNGLTIVGPKLGRSGPHGYTIDPSKDPKHLDIDWDNEKIPSTRVRREPKRDRGPQKNIYRFQGDTLEICLGFSGAGERPTEFTTKTTTINTHLMIFRRVETDKETTKQ